MTNKLSKSRQLAAEKALFESELECIECVGHWTEDANLWSCKIYWKNGDEPSTTGSFGVEFKEGTTQIISSWTN
jgi:hypothetical protein